MKKVTVVPGLRRRDIEKMVIDVLKEIQPRALEGKEPVDIEYFYECIIPEQHEVRTGYTDLSNLGAGIIGYTDSVNRISIVDKTLSDATHKPGLRRFRTTVAHESFHCIHHVPILSYFRAVSKEETNILYRVEKSQIKTYQDPEWQAWEFARSCLMPRHLVVKGYERGFSDKDFAEMFDVNPAFVRTRLKTLKLR